MAQSGSFHIFIVTYKVGKTYKTAKVRATNKRRAKTLAIQKFGQEIKIVSALRWQEFQKRLGTR